ncbi:hypothetical protein F5Y16DRAFT_352108 [Xylariaceae sp. FL0255]|nr:hypothetical protein F5Y16DRAFT_352108 [Xylariaceae sp. FL0255]
MSTAPSTAGGYHEREGFINGTYSMRGALLEKPRLRHRVRVQLERWPLRAAYAFSRAWGKRLDSASRLAKEEDLLGNWPRRLLHVPSMTSYEWKPGNWYGSHLSPRYNAISYTWGRWSLGETRMLGVEAIAIKGVSWEIPRVDPAHFTKEEFQAAIRRATTDVERGNFGAASSAHTLEWVWLDVACIDQRSYAPSSAAEVGRQAQIFGLASEVYIWLPQLNSLELQTAAQTVHKQMSTDATHQVHEAIGDHVSKLLADPWFSSLWTLQEAFLLGRAYGVFMPRDACVVPLNGSNLHFRDLNRLYVQYSALLEGQNWNDEMQTRTSAGVQAPTSCLKHCLDLMEHVGIAAVSSENGIAILTAASHRVTTNDEDRVYGIQQVFGFRLGVTANPDAIFTRVELDRQFERALLETYPLLSQLHVFTEPVPPGSRWRPNASSVARKSSRFQSLLPIDPLSGKPHDDLDPLCALSTSDLAGELWGHFTGRLSKFESLATRLSCIEQDPRWKHGRTVGEDFDQLSMFEVHLDVSTLSTGSPEYRSAGHHPVPSGIRQRALVNWIVGAFPVDDLCVLLLGPKLSISRVFGLLLLRQDHSEAPGTLQRWHRLGYCEWWRTTFFNQRFENFEGLPLEDKQHFPSWVSLKDLCFFQGVSMDWVETSGYFG